MLTTVKFTSDVKSVLLHVEFNQKNLVLVPWMIDRSVGGSSLLSCTHQEALIFTHQMLHEWMFLTTSECALSDLVNACGRMGLDNTS